MTLNYNYNNFIQHNIDTTKNPNTNCKLDLTTVVYYNILFLVLIRIIYLYC